MYILDPQIKYVIQNPELRKLLQRAYSAEKAASFAYQGHAASGQSADEKIAIHQIEQDEWNHRAEVLAIMQAHDIPVNKFFEIKYAIVGKIISASCHVIGWFMPIFFAGKLESGNVCEYFRMMKMFYEEGITQHNDVLFEMGIKEKEHEVYFLSKVKHKKWMAFFEKLFGWGVAASANDVDLDHKFPVEEARMYCTGKR